MGESLVISADRYKCWHVDYVSGNVRIVCRDGLVFDDRLEPRYQRHGSLVATSTFDWEKWWILSTTTKKDLIITEGFNPASDPPFNGRPSVYFDQNHWRSVADIVHESARVEDPGEPRAAQDLIRLANDGGIVLPPLYRAPAGDRGPGRRPAPTWPAGGRSATRRTFGSTSVNCRSASIWT